MCLSVCVCGTSAAQSAAPQKPLPLNPAWTYDSQVHKARYLAGKWSLAGERAVVGTAGGADAQLPEGEWNLGEFDAVVFADAGFGRAGEVCNC